jgi:uncharacterized protein YbaR (Trm112 family)
MKEELMDILCCPTCKGDLELKIINKDKDEILTGSLTCKKCRAIYGIEEGIPNLLPQ